ncbi:hypothetical protein BC936DRAFT_148810 [Jimgerdemannia flammicorona]|uniref:Uncharacterized protein n=1 Tax=Jimgerdemannia flammicorona TaxID=994334 RepID=A0A433D294_9FUNG|nr:hypothetical protein BC936DRAFT_148810 [Jimgerdemannia flammicorona]
MSWKNVPETRSDQSRAFGDCILNPGVPTLNLREPRKSTRGPSSLSPLLDLPLLDLPVPLPNTTFTPQVILVSSSPLSANRANQPTG